MNNKQLTIALNTQHEIINYMLNLKENSKYKLEIKTILCHEMTRLPLFPVKAN